MATVEVVERSRMPMITGEAELTSPWFSNRWTLTQQGTLLASLQRLGRIYVTAADLGEGGRLLIEPCGQGTVHAVDAAGDEVARIERKSWLGRLWEISGDRYVYELISDPRPRKWHIALANATFADLRGSLISYNHVRIASGLGLPIPAVLLAWHVIARPWEAAAEPRGLIPVGARVAGPEER
jgi:hypothetical protein